MSFRISMRRIALPQAEHANCVRPQCVDQPCTSSSGAGTGGTPASSGGVLRRGGTADWLSMRVRQIAEDIVEERRAALKERVGQAPSHLPH